MKFVIVVALCVCVHMHLDTHAGLCRWSIMNKEGFKKVGKNHLGFI